MARNGDRRIRRTKKAMTSALAALLSEKSLNHISVRELADLADINRGTFYLHYRDIYDMAEQIQNEIFTKFNEIVEQHEPIKGEEELFPMLVELFHLLSDNAELAAALIGKNGNAAFVEEMKQTIREKCFVNFQKKLHLENNVEFDYFYHYIVSGCIGICSAWLSSGRKEAPSEMARLTERLILNGADMLKK